MKYYQQCLLQKKNVQQISWIPDKYAQLGKFLKIKEENKWVDGWKVIEKYGKITEDYLKEHERDYLHQRSVSDI